MKITSQLIILNLILWSCKMDPNRDIQPAQDQQLLAILAGDVTGISFQNTIPESASMNSMSYEYYYNGGGVSIGDVNRDGLPDLFFTGNISPNKLYLNLGDFRFKDISEAAGIKDSPSWTTGSTMVDINEDGIMDIYVCRSGKLPEEQRANLFYVSQGLDSNGLPVYRNKAQELGLNDNGYGSQALFFDYDRDSDLDMYLLNHNVYVRPYYDLEKIREAKHPDVGDKLFRNEEGFFKEVTLEAGLTSNELGYGLGVSAGDFNNDGWTDLYVANDYSEHDFLYINQRNGKFKEVAKSSFGHMSNYSMGSDIGDINNDGLMDIVVLDMLSEDNYGIKTSMSGMNPELFQGHVQNGFHYQYMHNTLQLNRGNLQFSEIARYSGISSTDWSWAPLLLDLDLDGFQDLFVTNGLKRDFRNNDYRTLKIKTLEQAEEKPAIVKAQLIEALVSNTPQRHLSNYVYRNLDGFRFEKKIKDWGIESPTFSNGLSYGDLDNDGDLDLVVNNIDQTPFVYRNNAVELGKGSYLKVVLKGPEGNQSGIGTKVKLYQKGKVLTRELYLTRGYQSSVQPIVHFGVPKESAIDSLLILWPDGTSQSLQQIKPNQSIVVSYDESVSVEPTRFEQPLFSEVDLANTGLGYRHQENEYDDFEREVLLPHRMSRLGPGLDIGDFNGDGLNDVFVGGATGQAGSLYIQQANQTFSKSEQPALYLDRYSEDMDALFLDVDGDNDLDLYVVSGGNEIDQGNPALADRLYINENGRLTKSKGLPEINQSGYRIGADDFDYDGDLDLFLGARQVPGKYPYHVESWLLVNEKGSYHYAQSFDLGMVTDMVWTDYDQDGDKDIIVVGEWMPVTFLKNHRGYFAIDDEIKGMGSSTGWWNCIKSADFDRDGDLDYIVGNNGLNHKYQATKEEPFEMYAGDLDKNGKNDIVLAYYNEHKLYPLRGKECSTQQIPGLNNKFNSYHSFALASLNEVYNDYDLDKATKYQVFTFASSYIENLGGNNFSISALPAEAQFSCTNQMLIGDYNSDHHLDLILAGNNYQSEVETTRNDAGHGALLLGNGKGEFKVISPAESGLYLNGDFRDMSWITLGSGQKGILSVYNNSPLKFHILNQQR